MKKFSLFPSFQKEKAELTGDIGGFSPSAGDGAAPVSAQAAPAAETRSAPPGADAMLGILSAHARAAERIRSGKKDD